MSRLSRLRALVVLLALATIVPAVLLAKWALGASAAEQREKRRAAAELVFDAMQDELAVIASQEALRPFTDYRPPLTPDRAQRPAHLVGWFQVEPDGSITSPLPPDDPRLPRVLSLAQVWAQRAPEAVPRKDEPRAAERPKDDYASVVSSVVGKRAQMRAPPGELQNAWTPPDVQIAFANDGRARAIDDNVIVRPLTGATPTPGAIVLSRQVELAGLRYVQAAVVDLDALQAHLVSKTIADTPLQRLVTLTWGPRGRASGPHARRFEDPFGGLTASISLGELPGADTSVPVAAMAAALAVVVLLGLGAVYSSAAAALAHAERRSAFVAAVSHELRTPLTAIRMHAEMLRDGMVPEARRASYHETITAEAERLTRLVDGVLELARSRRGARAQVGDEDVGTVVTQAVALLQPAARDAGFELSSEVESNLPRARGDREALLQVVVNLVDNALKHARRAERRVVTVMARRASDRVEIVVRDTGPGVAPEHLRDVFEPFWRVQPASSGPSRGVGLGLALVHGLVESMGGTVTARNIPGGFEVQVALKKGPGPI